MPPNILENDDEGLCFIDECDGCGCPETETKLSNDHGVPVCRYCVEGGDIQYDDPAINENATIRFLLEYSLQKEGLGGEDVMLNAFKKAGLKSAIIDFNECPFGVTVKLSEEDALMFKLKDLKDVILQNIRTHGA